MIAWEKIKGPRAVTALIAGTALGAGLTPVMPGTMGSLVAIPLVYLTADAPWPERVLIWLALFILGTWAAKVLDEVLESSDNQKIVIDEVVGVGITACTANNHPSTLIAAFVLFRIFDILKPYPVRQLDRWSKVKASEKSGALSAWWGGFGVMADDVGAALQGLILILILQYFNILP